MNFKTRKSAVMQKSRHQAASAKPMARRKLAMFKKHRVSTMCGPPSDGTTARSKLLPVSECHSWTAGREEGRTGKQAQSGNSAMCRPPPAWEQQDLSPSWARAGKKGTNHPPPLPCMRDWLIWRNTGCDGCYQGEMQLDAWGALVFH